MNMILCGKDCKHQKDGCCRLDSNATLSNVITNDCCYYQKDGRMPAQDRKHRAFRAGK